MDDLQKAACLAFVICLALLFGMITWQKSVESVAYHNGYADGFNEGIIHGLQACPCSVAVVEVKP